MIKYKIQKTPEYQKWIDKELARSQVLIEARLSMIEFNGHFGDHRSLDDGVWELKWVNGRRIYYAYIPKQKILLLLGGNKNGQKKDVIKAKKIFKKYQVN